MNTNSHEIATLAGGCFWCLDAVYRELKGVMKVEAGYSGGDVPNPSYQLVCTDTTGHAEVVQITYDPGVVSYRQLLKVFFTIHDPTTRDRQGADVGKQYRSAIFFHNPEQEKIARQVITELENEGIWPGPIVTEIVPLKEFYRAEEYHQNYFANNPGQGYCRIIIAPKVAKFRKKFFEKLKT